jgi:hypothetical protein
MQRFGPDADVTDDIFFTDSNNLHLILCYASKGKAFRVGH